MNTLSAILVAGSSAVALIVGLVRTVARDGLGHRPAPGGTRPWAEGTTLDVVR